MGMMCVLHQQGITPKRHVLPKEIQIWLFPLGNVWNFTLVIWTGHFTISENPWNILVFSCKNHHLPTYSHSSYCLSVNLDLAMEWNHGSTEAPFDFSGPSCSDLCLPDRVDMGANRPSCGFCSPVIKVKRCGKAMVDEDSRIWVHGG